ncbi:CHAT domain-containing protein [Leptolyngbya sp. AN03gr2]|uniref:CHAT domain-containing protein n=1 Tax=unclassified Leptolyngbya TaxID=2650499 RepID=UPI003D317047
MVDEQRMQAYGALIEQLLNCHEGEEANILQNHPDLVDARLLAAMEQVAVHLESQGSENAQWLKEFAAQLAETLGLKQFVPQASESTRQFLLETFQMIADNQDAPQQIYPVWSQQVAHLNPNLLEALPQVASQLYGDTTKSPDSTAHNLSIFGQLIAGFSEGFHWLNLEIAITAYEQALRIQTLETVPEQWATTQYNLASAYEKRVQGEEASNIEYAIAAYEKALQVCTSDAFPKIWARIHFNLGKIYERQRIQGEKANNIETAISLYEGALQIYEHDTFPIDWALTKIYLAVAYENRIQGDKSDNLEQTISAYYAALQVFTREEFPGIWAETQCKLGYAYEDRILGERAENLEYAVASFHLALQVFTREAFPEEWAGIQDDLAHTYGKRIKGERADNLEMEITAYQQALQVYTCEAFPRQWARIQCNLGFTYSERIRGERADNLEMAIAKYELALQVRTREASPEEWATTLNGLGLAYVDRIRGERANNIETAIALYECALQVRTREALQEEWVETQVNLAAAYMSRIQGEKAENLEKSIMISEQTLQVCTRETSSEKWAALQGNLAVAYVERIRGEKANNLDQAIAVLEQTLQVYTCEAFPEKWAMSQMNLAYSYIWRIRGERADNLELSIAYSKQALQVFTREGFPEQWAKTKNNLAAAYLYRIRGERSGNLEQSIAYSEQALQVCTHEAFPEQWAMIQINLANAYVFRIQGYRAENLELSIIFSKQALQVYSHQAFPERWATAQNNLATAYLYRIQGERSDNFEQAIAYFELLLQEVYTRETFPEQWARTQMNLAAAYLYRIRGKKAKNLEQAIIYSEQALRVYTYETFPEQWAMVQMNLASIYGERIQGERSNNIEQAITISGKAIQVFTYEAFPEQWAMVQMNLANTYLSRVQGEKAENLEHSITLYKQALQVFTRGAFPEKWAMTQYHLAVAYENRIQEEKADNLAQAIAAYEKALKVFTPIAFPNDCRRTASCLGSLHFKKQAWLKSAKAYTRALRAAERLYQNCILLDGKTTEISETGNLPAYAAYALAHCGHLRSAALVLERSRARGLSEIIDRDRTNLEELKQLNFALYSHYREIAHQIRNLEAQQREYVTSGTTAKEKYQVRQSLTPEAHSLQARQLYQSLGTVIKQIRQVEGYADFLKPTDFTDIHAAVQSDRSLVYITGTSAGILVLTVTPHKVTDLWLSAHTHEALGKTLKIWLKAYGERQLDESIWLEAIDQSTHQLWHLLMEPLIQHLKAQNLSHAVLIPSGVWSFFPFHAAWTENAKSPSGRRYALDEIHFTYTPNAKSLTTAQGIVECVQPNVILAIDNPTQDLAYSEWEVQGAVSHFEQHIVLRHANATQETVLSNLLRATIVHFSCHGQAYPTEAEMTDPETQELTEGFSPLDSICLQMSDGKLTLKDILALNLSEKTGIRLAILSACETGLSGVLHSVLYDIANTDEAISLPAGLLQVGVAGVIASLWAVSELSTMILLARFYDLWRKENLPIDHALCQAQIWIRDTTSQQKAQYFQFTYPDLFQRLVVLPPNYFAHSFHWAAFSYTGA